MKNDVVNHPSHYTDGNIEVIDFIEDKGLGFCLGNAIKYISRAGKKYPDKEIEDLEKAVWYINRRIKELKKEKNEKEVNENICLFESEKDKLDSLGNSKEIVDEFEKNTEIKPIIEFDKDMEKNAKIEPIRGLRAKIGVYDEVVNPTIVFDRNTPQDQLCDALFNEFHAADPNYTREQFDEDWADAKEAVKKTMPTLMELPDFLK